MGAKYLVPVQTPGSLLSMSILEEMKLLLQQSNEPLQFSVNTQAEQNQ